MSKPMPVRMPNSKVANMLQNGLKTAIHSKNCSPEDVTLCSSPPEKWTATQRQRAGMLFDLYPDLKNAYWLSQDLRAIFNRRSTKDSARLNLARWYNRVADSGFKSFNTIAATFYEHSDEILNFYDNRSTNASAESINSKIKAFRARLHGVNDKKFFIFRLCNIYA